MTPTTKRAAAEYALWELERSADYLAEHVNNDPLCNLTEDDLAAIVGKMNTLLAALKDKDAA